MAQPQPTKLTSRRWLIIVAALIVVAAALWWYWSQREEPKPKEGTPEAQYFSPERKKRDEERLQKLSEAIRNAKTEGERLSILKQIPKAFRMYDMASKLVKDVNFVGQVLDQHGAPVEGAAVTVIGGGAYFAGGSGHGGASTDASGKFRLAGVRGASLQIREITRKGYDVTVWRQPHLFFSYDDPGSQRVAWWHCKEEKPCVFQAWKYPADAVGLNDILSDDGRVRVPLDTPVELDLTASENQLAHSRSGRRQLELRFERSGEGPIDEGRNWVLHIRALDGGIVRAEGMYPNEAPENGYLDELVLRAEEVTPAVTKDELVFYVRLQSVNCYGSVALRVHAASTDGLRTQVRYVINAAGGRALRTAPELRSPGIWGPWVKRVP